jgi:hyperosmotically inducible protein
LFKRLLALLVLIALGAVVLYVYQSRHGRPLGRPELGAVGRKFDDLKLTGSVKAALGLNRALEGSDLSVSSENGVVTLRGSVPSESARQQAKEIAAAVPDVRQVVDQIDVTGAQPAPAEPGRSLGESLDDGALSAKVRLALSLRRELEGTDIGVRTFRKQVTLTGRVGTPEQRRIAVETAGQTEGVEAVADQIGQGPGAAPSAAATARLDRAAAEQAVRQNPNLAPYGIQVVEEGGRLVLKGVVRTGAERDLAGALAAQAAGGPVLNILQVNP